MGRRDGRGEGEMDEQDKHRHKLTASRVCCFHHWRADVGFFSPNTVFLPGDLSPGGVFIAPVPPVFV